MVCDLNETTLLVGGLSQATPTLYKATHDWLSLDQGRSVNKKIDRTDEDHRQDVRAPTCDQLQTASRRRVVKSFFFFFRRRRRRCPHLHYHERTHGKKKILVKPNPAIMVSGRHAS